MFVMLHSLNFNYIAISLYIQKDHYLGLSVGNDNWWRTHGIGCGGESGDREEGSGTGDASNTGECKASYAVSNK